MVEEIKAPRVIDFIDEFVEALKKDLLRGEAKWGNTWLNRPREGQEIRILETYIKDKLDQFKYAGTPINWAGVAGEAMIGWIREHHPELFPE